MRKRFHIIFIVVVLIVGVAMSALAVAPTEDVLKKMKDDGTLSSYIEMMAKARTRGIDAPEAPGSKSIIAAKGLRAVDTVHVLVLLVDFSDHPYTSYGGGPNTAAFDSVLFSTGKKNPTGSMTEYYLENSYGKFYIIGDVRGWYRMPLTYAFYVNGADHGLGSYPTNAQRLAEDAVNAADSDGVNFALYDNFGSGNGPDGNVDGLFIVHAGAGFEESGGTDIHSHKWNLYTPLFYDGKSIDAYTCEPEISFVTGKISPIGVFCHEYGHFLGLPDLYVINDTTSPYATGLGRWSLMAMGNYNNNSKSPAHMDAWCKIEAGFATSISPSGNVLNASIPQAETDPVFYSLWTNGISTYQYFLVENRQQTGFDTLLPGSGLLIYHIDDIGGDIYGNNVEGKPYHVALEQADGLRQLESGASEGDVADPWPGATGKRSFDDLSVPDSRGYGPTISKVSVWDISNSDSLMTANLDVTWSRPHFAMDSLKFADPNANGILEPGETVELYFYLRNCWLTANNVQITVSTNDNSLHFLDSTMSVPTFLGDSGAVNNIGAPMRFVIPDTLIPTFDSFFVSVVSDGGLYTAAFGVEKQIGPAQVLLVDDDRGGNYETVYWGDLYKKNIPADIWTKKTQLSPPLATLGKYKIVIWFTGDSALSYLNTADINVMKQYLDNSGSLFLTGQGLAKQLNSADTSFLSAYLHCHYSFDSSFYPSQVGVPGSSIGDGIKVKYFSGAPQKPMEGGSLTPVNGGIPEFEYEYLTDKYSAMSYRGNYKLLFFDWGYEAVNSLGNRSYISRDSLLSRVLGFFGGNSTEINSDGTIAAIPKNFDLEQNYPNPFNPTTIIKYSIRSTGTGQSAHTVLRIYNIAGQVVKTLIDRLEAPGTYAVEWDGSDNSGGRCASGVYLYKLSRGNDKETRKMVLLK